MHAESIYTALVECLKSKNIQLSNLIGMGFDGAATFSGKKSGIQARMKKHSPHALFVHCHCHHAINFNWIVCRLQMVQQVLSIFM